MVTTSAEYVQTQKPETQHISITNLSIWRRTSELLKASGSAPCSMAVIKNLGLVYNAVPEGVPIPGLHLIVEDIPIDLDAELSPDHILVQSVYASLDPYLRQMLVDSTDSIADEGFFQLGKSISSMAVAKVIRSTCDQFKVGDTVTGMFPFSQYSINSLAGNNSPKGVTGIQKVSNPYELNDLSLFLGPLGLTGLTAFSSLHDIGKPQRGETIFISSAAGAVGQVVGILAKNYGLTVLGSVGSDEKLRYLIDDLGFDGGFNYKKEAALPALKRLAADGVDIYYDNVGGEQLEAALDCMKNFGRIIACGMISDYNKPRKDWYGVQNLIQIVEKRLSMRGFIVSDDSMGLRYQAEHQRVVGAMLKDGSGKFVVDQMGTIDGADQAFLSMLQGRNFGKAVVKMIF